MEPVRWRSPWRKVTQWRTDASRWVLCVGLLVGMMPTALPLRAQTVPPGKDMGVGFCPKHKRDFKGWTCPKCKEETDQLAVPIPDTSDPDADRRAREAQAERKRQLDQENARVAKEEKERQAKFARERDARAKQLKGTPDSGLSQLKGVAGSGNSGLKGGGFDTGSSGLKGMGGPGQGTAPHTDSSVVDARMPRDGASLTNQVPELKNSPAADRITKGWQAVLNHDWPVALAWWQDALQRDPGNAALKRSVDLAQWMVDRQKAKAAGPIAAPTTTGIAHDEIALAIHQVLILQSNYPALAAQVASLLTALKQVQARDEKTAKTWKRDVLHQSRILIYELILEGDHLMTLVPEKNSEIWARLAYEDAAFMTWILPRGGPSNPQPPKPTSKKPTPKGGPAEGNL